MVSVSRIWDARRKALSREGLLEMVSIDIDIHKFDPFTMLSESEFSNCADALAVIEHY